MATRTTKELLFRAIPVIVILGAGAAAYVWLRPDPAERGVDLNRRAWEATYLERGEPVPIEGPREGYWGGRLYKNTTDERLGWRETPISVPGLLQIGTDGLQHYDCRTQPRFRVLIVGGSVAFGAYASTIEQAYFHRLGRALEALDAPADIVVAAAGAWKAVQDVNAIAVYLPTVQPDLVIMLDGLNDLTNGSNAGTLYGKRTITLDGSEWTPLYHEHDYDARVAGFCQQVDFAGVFAAQREVHVLVALQPSLVEHEPRTAMEEELLRGSLVPHASAAALTDAYEAIRRSLGALAESKHNVHFLDASRAFRGTIPTIFTDLWHFADHGHAALAELMAPAVAEMLLDIEAARETGDG